MVNIISDITRRARNNAFRQQQQKLGQSYNLRSPRKTNTLPLKIIEFTIVACGVIVLGVLVYYAYVAVSLNNQLDHVEDRVDMLNAQPPPAYFESSVMALKTHIDTLQAQMKALNIRIDGMNVSKPLATPVQPFVVTNPFTGNTLLSVDSYGDTKFTSSVAAQRFTVMSDKRLKENIYDLPDMRNELDLLRPVQYNMVNQSRLVYGFIAQDVQRIIPSIVYQTGEYLGISEFELIPLLVDAYQKQQEEIRELRRICR